MIKTAKCDLLIRRSLEDKTKNLSLEYQEQMCRKKGKEGYEVVNVYYEEL